MFVIKHPVLLTIDLGRTIDERKIPQLKYLLTQFNYLLYDDTYCKYLKISSNRRRNIPDSLEAVAAASQTNFSMQARPLNPWLNKYMHTNRLVALRS